MIDERRPVGDTRALAFHQVRKVVVLFQPPGCLGKNGAELAL